MGSVGGSVARGTAKGVLDYLDMNGDGYPDVVGAAGVQYTDPTGVLGATKGSVPGGSVRESENVTGNASAGSAARTITTGRGNAAPSAGGTANTSTSGNDMPPLGVGGNLGTGKSDGRFDLLDINGDSLPDRVYEDGRAALNLGYRFAAAEPWPGGKINEGTSSSSASTSASTPTSTPSAAAPPSTRPRRPPGTPWPTSTATGSPTGSSPATRSGSRSTPAPASPTRCPSTAA